MSKRKETHVSQKKAAPRICWGGEKKGCPAINPTGFMCTREAGHKGLHMACGESLHKLATWKRSP